MIVKAAILRDLGDKLTVSFLKSSVNRRRPREVADADSVR